MDRAMITRRHFFQGLIGASTFAFIGSLLSACGSNQEPTRTTVPSTPAFTPATGTSPSPTAVPSPDLGRNTDSRPHHQLNSQTQDARGSRH